MPGQILSVPAHRLPAGWYGKLPALGDFASRRLPPAFVAAWDAWLGRSIGAGRARLGAHWPEAFVRAPAWRFLLLPGVCGPSGWAGVMLPSADAVGRCFPLTVAAALRPGPGMLATALDARDWFERIEQAGCQAVRAGLPAQALDARLEAIGPAACAGRDDHAAALARWWRSSGAQGFHARLPGPHALDDCVLAGAECAFVGAGGARSLWWSVAGPHAAVPLHAFAGLPDADGYALLIESAAAREGEG